MTFTPGQATDFTDPAGIATLTRAFRKTGRPVVLVPLGAGIHAGHLAAVRAARQIRGGIVVVALHEGVNAEMLQTEEVDAVFRYSPESLWPKGMRTVVHAADHGLEPAGQLSVELTRLLTLTNLVGPSDLVLGEKDYELLIAVQHAITDLHLSVKLHGVPTVRTTDGVAMSLRNPEVAAEDREKAMVLSAALTAGAYAAEDGADRVLEVARSVLSAAGVEVEYLELRSLDLRDAPTEGDARLLVAATIGGVRLLDNVGVPVGIGFRNLGEQE
ncbi:pantoate--beta-alanine ligase [Corynebacterium halotolerans]|uniref:pantoate--beta-alanine ligase n=1 Tax=Corynebacterium halotolerans TaxID=225326 RepID=UPI003CF8C47D